MRFLSFFVPFFFFFNDTATTEIYTLSLHDALPISLYRSFEILFTPNRYPKQLPYFACAALGRFAPYFDRSEEHTSELQSQSNLVCRLLLEKKKAQVHADHRCSVRTTEVYGHYDSML